MGVLALGSVNNKCERRIDPWFDDSRKAKYRKMISMVIRRWRKIMILTLEVYIYIYTYLLSVFIRIYNKVMVLFKVFIFKIN